MESIIEFLASCGEADIEAGIGAIFGFGSDEKQSKFKAGLTNALKAPKTYVVYQQSFTNPRDFPGPQFQIKVWPNCEPWDDTPEWLYLTRTESLRMF